MARNGIFKTDVKQARDALLARHVHPSVDAVRVALGNTGSKTTIHRYLKELEQEDGGAKDVKASSISDALQDLVGRLANRLHDEANAQVDAIRAEQQAKEHRHAETLAAAQQEIDQLRALRDRLERSLSDEQAAHAGSREASQRETVLRHTAEQHAVDLKERLAENDAYRQSLEEKHRHAREALEHYRQSVKEQREHDQRRHEHQIQQLQAELRLAQQAAVVKQEEVTRLNQEGVRLVADLSHAQKALYDAQTHLRQQEQKLENLQGIEQKAAMLAEQVADREHQIKALTERLTLSVEQSTTLASRFRDLELQHVTTLAKFDAQQIIVDELRRYVTNARQLPPILQSPQENLP